MSLLSKFKVGAPISLKFYRDDKRMRLTELIYGFVAELDLDPGDKDTVRSLKIKQIVEFIDFLDGKKYNTIERVFVHPKPNATAYGFVDLIR
ncbi:MAG TPA: hypothetical protein VK590_12375 [Saprospiraceae bacterium]|nr:hypothetical protein [Saprospiraceae bacterium]